VTAIAPIPTRYAGCHFRSRLEARWAVCFDTLGIRWEYERQGYLCSPRLSQLGTYEDETGRWVEPPKIAYLPDFWFPDYGLHGEVKATMTDDELLRLLDCAASLSSNDGGGCHDRGGNDLLVFGNIPSVMADGCSPRLPTLLHMHKGDLEASGWDDGTSSGCGGESIARDYGCQNLGVCVLEYAPAPRSPNRSLPEKMWPSIGVRQWLTRGSWADQWSTPARFRRWEVAYAAARSARFEHGQHGAT